MRKEVLLAIIFGIVLGGVILYGINLANKSVSVAPPKEKTANSMATPTPSVASKTLEILNPTNHFVTAEKTILVTGKALPNSNLAIVSEADDLLLQTTSEGTFSAKINLISGENSITVTELLENNSTISDKITIIQSASLSE